MAYTPGFAYDLFVSFAHRDNAPCPGQSEAGGWVRHFVDYLTWWLATRRGLAGLDVWLDEQRLTGATDYDPRIQRDLGRTALLVVLHSHNYRASAYCEKELGWFLDAAKAHPLGLTVDGERRVLHLLLNNIPRRDWSAGAHWTGELAGTPGFRFHDAADDDADAFGDPIDPAQDADFKAALRPVVDAVTKLLRAMTQATPKPSAPVPTSAPTPVSAAKDDRPALFIADVPDNLSKLRKRAVTTLAARARILPPIPPPGTRAEHDRAFAELLRGTDLSIHLLGEQPGRELDDSDETFSRRQCDLVRAADRPALIWLPDDLDPAQVGDPDHRAWLAGLEDVPRGADGFRIARGSREQLLADLAELVAELASRRAGAEGRGIVIDPHAADQTYGFKLALALKEHAPHLPLALTRDGAEPVERWSDFEQLVQRARDLIVLFGQVQPAWVRRRVERAAKLAAAAERPALERIWVLLLPEHREPPSLPRLAGAPRLALLDNSATPEIAPANVQQLLLAAGARS